MRTAPKIALSLLLTILLFLGLAVAAYAGLFNILETRFYQPSVISSMEDQLNSTSRALTDWHTQNIDKFSEFIAEEPVKRSLLPNQSEKDIFDRSNLAGNLLAEMEGLAGIRIIDAGDTTILPEDDKGTRRIHFSTFKEDILKKEELQISYENYGIKAEELPFKTISRPDGAKLTILMETGKDLFLYCFPFYDAYSTWRGTAVFYVTGRSAARYLVSQNLFRISDDLVLLSNSEYTISGTITGMPQVGQDILEKAILDRWSSQNFIADRIVSTDSSGWVLLSDETNPYGYTGQLVPETMFTFPKSVKILFLAISFLTLFLVFFLLFNLKQDEMMVIRNRIRRFHVELLNEIIAKNEEVRWDEIRKNLAYRRHDINSEIKKGFGRKLNKKHSEQINALLGKSWDEILSALGQQETKQTELTNTDDIRRMLEQVLQSNAITLNLKGLPESTSSASSPKQVVAKKLAKATQPIPVKKAKEEPEDEDLEEMEEVEEIEEIAEGTEAETLDELEEIEEIEEVTEVVQAETLDEFEEVEEIEEVSEIAEIEQSTDDESKDLMMQFAPSRLKIENIEEIDEVEEISEFEELQEFEKFEDVPGSLTESLLSFEENQEEQLNDEPDLMEVEYLEGEWEPHLLEVATEEELIEFIEENVPDTVLVFNFEEKLEIDINPRINFSEISLVDDESIVIAGLDFTALDTSVLDAEEISEETYIDPFIFDQTKQLQNTFNNMPIYEFLEVIGDETPEELLDLVEGLVDENGAIIQDDGLYMVSMTASPEQEAHADPEFQKLVDSVLL